MKKQILNRITKTILLVAMAMMVMVACDKDDDDDQGGTGTPVEDGTYVTGAATGVTSPGINGLMKVARNEVVQEDRNELKEIYMAVKGGADGFNIVMVNGSTTTTYGPGSDFAEVTELDNDEPTLGLWRGSLAESAEKFTVPEDGLYHIAFDSEIMIVVIAKVEWGLIGAATPGGWGGSTALPMATFDMNSLTFEATDVVLTKADWKFRYSNGWKLILDPDFDLGSGNTGIKVNSNFGGAVDALLAGGDNITNETPGKYTATMTWNLSGGHTASMVKTGDLETIDYSATELGLIGDGLMVGGVQHDWESTIMLHVPVIDPDVETNYTWTYEGVEVTTAGSFKIREGQTWDDKSIGFGDVTMAGLAAADFEGNGDGNFVPLMDGTYDFVLLIDAVTETYTLTVNAAGAAVPEMYLVGDFTGWDIDNPVPMDGTAGEYTATVDLGTGGFFKAVTTVGAWQPQYGTEAGAAWDSGILLLNDGTGSDPEGIPEPSAAGTYTVSINTNTMTYTVAAK